MKKGGCFQNLSATALLNNEGSPKLKLDAQVIQVKGRQPYKFVNLWSCPKLLAYVRRYIHVNIFIWYVRIWVDKTAILSGIGYQEPYFT